MNARMEDIIQPPLISYRASLSSEGAATEELDVGTTEVLSKPGDMVTKEMVQQEVDESHGMFRIEKSEMYIHTDEVV